MPVSTAKLLLTLDAGEVERYHSAPSVPAQTVGQHSHNVALIVMHATGEVYHHWTPMFVAALLHDSEEIITGDMPATTKWGNPELETALKKAEQNAAEYVYTASYNGDAEVKKIVKLADTLDGMRWCWFNERMDPNQGIKVVHARWAEAFKTRYEEDAGVLDVTMDRFAELYHQWGGVVPLEQSTAEPSAAYTNQD